jgi:integrase
MKTTLPIEKWLEIIHECPMPWCDVFRLQLESGCRVGEILNLTAECLDVDDDGRCWIHVREHLVRALDGSGDTWRPKRPSSVRTVEVPKVWRGRFERAWDGSIGRLVFFPGQGKPPTISTALWHLRKAARRCGVTEKVGTHDLRRVRITQALVAGADPVTVARAVGHASLRTTLGYIRSIPMRCALPSLDSGAATNAPAAAWKGLVTPKNWRK